MRRILAVLLICALLCGNAMAGDTGFTDVSKTTWSWAYDDIMSLTSQGIIKGVGDGRFDPDGTLIVADFLTLLGRMLYPDECVEEGMPYYWYSYWENAFYKGIIYEEKFYDITNLLRPITRYEMADMLVAADYFVLGRELVETYEKVPNDYIDESYSLVVNQAYNKGLLNGDEYGNFNGTDNLTRAETAVVLSRLQKVANSIGFVPGATQNLAPDVVEENTEFVEVMDMTGKQYPQVTVEMENGGTMVFELYPDKAPNTVANFISLAKDGFYDGLIFHRVISGFMIQGGDPLGSGAGGPGYGIDGEFINNGYVANDISHQRGVISMARATSYNSAGSQFFICHATSPHLDGDYAAFGRILSGLDIVDEIAATAIDSSNRPISAQTIKSITVETFGVDYPAPLTNNNR